MTDPAPPLDPDPVFGADQPAPEVVIEETILPEPEPPLLRPVRVTIYDGRTYAHVGQVPDYLSISVTWAWLAVGTGTLVVEETDEMAAILLGGGQTPVVPITVEMGDQRWSGRVASATLERDGGPPGSGTVTAQLVDEWAWLRSMHASQHGADPTLPTTKETWAAKAILDRMNESGSTINADWSWDGADENTLLYKNDLHAQWVAAGSPTAKTWLSGYITAHSMPNFDTRKGPAATVAASYINDAAARLGVPVVAVVPGVDTSETVTLNARMDTLVDLLTDPMRGAGVDISGYVWLPGDPQPAGLHGRLNEATVVFECQSLPEKEWLRWTDTVGEILSFALTVNTGTAYRTIIGADGTDDMRIYDEMIDVGQRQAQGIYGLPEVYTEALNTDVGGDPALAAGRLALADTQAKATLQAQVVDGSPWYFGQDYRVGEVARVNIGGVDFLERVTQVTVTDDRETGLTYVPTIGDNPAAATSEAQMIRAVERVARSLRGTRTRR